MAYKVQYTFTIITMHRRRSTLKQYFPWNNNWLFTTFMEKKTIFHNFIPDQIQALRKTKCAMFRKKYLGLFIFYFGIMKCIRKWRVKSDLKTGLFCHYLSNPSTVFKWVCPKMSKTKMYTIHNVIYSLCKIVLTNKQTSFNFIKNPHFK